MKLVSFLFYRDEEKREVFYRNHVKKSALWLLGYSSVVKPCHFIPENNTIGRYVSIGPNVYIAPGQHPTDCVSTSSAFYDKIRDKVSAINGSVEIGHDVWIGCNVTIQNNVKIGTGAVIGSGAVVTKDIPPYAIAVGVPAKVIKYRFSPEIIEELLASKWWNYPHKVLKKLSYEDVNMFLKQIKELE